MKIIVGQFQVGNEIHDFSLFRTPLLLNEHRNFHWQVLVDAPFIDLSSQGDHLNYTCDKL